MAATFGLQDIANATPYWLERNLYTQVVPTLAAGADVNLFSVNGWNQNSSANVWVELSRLGLTQIPGLRVDLVADGQSYQFWADEFPSALRLAEVGAGAIRRISLTLTNTTSVTVTNIQAAMLMTVWVLPVANKITLGYGASLSASDRAVAQQANVPLNPVADYQVMPIDIDTIIERTYYARRIGPWLSWAQSVKNVGPSTPPFWAVTAGPNQGLVLLEAAVDAPLAAAVTLTVNRDAENSAALVRGDVLTRFGQPFFLPANQQLQFQLTAPATVPGQVPVRLRVLQYSLSAINLTRTRSLTTAELATLIEQSTNQTAKAAQSIAADLNVRVLAGVR